MSILVEIPESAYRCDAFAAFAAHDGFDLGTARALMWLAQLAYESRHAQHKLKNVLDRWSLQPVAVLANNRASEFPLTSTRGIVAQGRGATFVSFAGTDPLALANWITNFNLGPRARLLHQGFEAGVDAVWPALRRAIERRPDPAGAIFLTGHSLGGALAIVAAERIRRELGIAADGVYAFGAPRVGGERFAAAYAACGLDECTWRLVHGLDIIATLPPSRLGFRHVGRLRHCRRGECFDAAETVEGSDAPLFAATLAGAYRQRVRDLLTGGFMRSSRAGVIGWYQTFMMPPALADHLPERYRRAVEAAVPAA